MTESLTDEERNLLVRTEARIGGSAAGRKALRIIDAQTAALDRVLAECAGSRAWHERTQQLVPALLVGIERALAAAPEHTGPEVIEDQAQLRACVAKLNARVAELEDATKVLHAAWTRASDGEDAANARADAAEQRRVQALRLCEEREQALKRAESERDEWKAKCEAVERDASEYYSAGLRQAERLDAAESEAAALRAELSNTASLQQFQMVSAECETLRAEVEHLRGENLHPCGAREADMIALKSSLSTATDFLSRIQHNHGEVFSEIRAFLRTAAPAPTERVECVSGYVGANGECNDCGKLDCPMADHELLAAERAVKG